MHFKNILKAFGIASMASFALARDDCETISKEISDYEVIFPIQNCETNDAGEVTSFQIYDVNYTIDGDTLKKILKYDTITELKYYLTGDNDDFYNKPITGFYIENLKNLEKFSFTYDYTTFGENGFTQYQGSVDSKILKSLNKVKEVSISGIYLTQDNIDELVKLKNIERLYLEFVNDDMNLYELCTQKKCYIDNVIYDPTSTIKVKNDCNEIRSELFKEVNIMFDFICDMNDNGEVKRLSISNDHLKLSENTLKKVFKSTITDLSYTISGSETYDYNVNFYVDNIENLEKFTFYNYCYGESVRGRMTYIRPLNSDALKSLTKVKELTLKQIAISQDNIDEISKFKNLEKMEFFKCEMNGLNLDTLCSKAKCYINNEEVVPTIKTTTTTIKPKKTTTTTVKPKKTTTTTVKPKKTTTTTTVKPKKTTTTTTVKPKKTTTTTTTITSKPTTTSYSSLRYYGTNGSKYPLGVSELGKISKITLNRKNKYNNWFSTGTKISYLHLSDSTTEKAGKPSGYCLDVNTASTDARGNYYLKVVKCSQAKHKFRYIKDANSINTTNIMIYNADNTIFKDADGNNLCVYYATNPTTHTCGSAKNNSSLGWRRTLGDVITV